MYYQLPILILIITLSEALGQYLLRLYAQKNNTKYWYLPFFTWIFYAICTVLLLETYKYTTMGKAEVYWDALSAVIVPIIGILAFKEKLNFTNWFGIFLIVIGTLLV